MVAVVVNVSRIWKEKGASLPIELEKEVEPLEAGEETIPFVEPWRVRGEITNAGRVLVAKGKLTTAVELVCHRCLQRFRYPIAVTWECAFSRTVGSSQGIDDEEGEEIYPCSGEEVDLSEPLRQEVILSLPMRWLCSEECPGLAYHPEAGGEKVLPRREDWASEEIDPRLRLLQILLKGNDQGVMKNG